MAVSNVLPQAPGALAYFILLVSSCINLWGEVNTVYS